jgi:murein DD-endopeptidase MepM/ murein hydrolase activator NlpD
MPAAPARLSLDCAGRFAQGGIGICRTLPGAQVIVGGGKPPQRTAVTTTADGQGFVVVGFDRDAPVGPAVITATAQGQTVRRTVAVTARAFSVQRINGLPPQTVTPTEPEVLARIQRDTATKNRGFASLAEARGFLDGFRWPVEGRISGSWGNQRVLNGEPRTPHYGVDIAQPTGTPILAPAGGVVALAEPDLHFEGGLVLLDHGQGLISMYLHMSRLDVALGQTVSQGQVLGAVGASGRATGPHLCWRLRWRGRQLDPSLAIPALAEARLALASMPTAPR